MDSTTAAGGPQDGVVRPSDDANGPRDRVSVTAFGFSLIGFSLVAIPLGVWGLVRTRSGAGGGRGFALAALGVSAAWIVATFALVATSGLLSNIDTIAAADLPEGAPAAVASVASGASGASATPSSTPAASSAPPDASQPNRPLSKPRKIYWEDLTAGMCLRTAPESALDMPVVDCRAAHEDEVITRTVMAGPGKWPGDEVIETSAEAKCRTAFATYVGIGYDDSRLELDFWTVDPDGWRDGGRTLVCLVYDPSDPTLTGALKGTAQ